MASSKLGCFGLAAVAFIVICMIVGSHRPSAGGNSVAEATDPSPEKPDPHKAERDLQGKTALAAGMALKSSARDPDSLVIETGLASGDGKLLCVRYRSRNGFGGMNREAVAFFNSVPHDSASFWNKHCANRTLNDVTDQVKLGVSMS